jgi:ferredoxin-NADP reductase
VSAAGTRHIDAATPWDDRTQQLECVAVVAECPDVASFTFRAGEDTWFRYLAGQFVTLELPTAQGTVLRPYTLSSSPTRPWTITVSVKAQAGSVGTRWMLDHLRPGMRLRAHGPAGAFCAALHPAPRYLFLSAGSGITPMMSMSRAAQDRAPGTDIVFVNCAQHPGALIFRAELEQMAARLPRFTLAWMVEDVPAGQSWSGFRGRLGAASLRLIAPDFKDREVFCCGPAPFMQAARDLLEAAGFDMAHYHEERFHPAVVDVASGDPAAARPREDAAGAASPATGELVFVTSGVAVPITGDHTLLQLARSAGLNIPTGCTMGLCGTCKVHCLSGRTEMHHSGGIRPEEIDAGFVLACCTRPLGRVEIAV